MAASWCAMKHIFTPFCIFKHHSLAFSLAFITFAASSRRSLNLFVWLRWQGGDDIVEKAFT